MNKSKILNILTIFIAILLIILTTVGITLAATETINGKQFTTNGGTYHNAFQDKGSNLFNVTWNDVKNKYYTAGSTNDYQDYIVNSKDGYCLNENAGDGGNQNFYVAAIVDIEGGNVKVYSRSSNGSDTIYAGDTASEFAKAIYNRYHNPESKNTDGTGMYPNRTYVHNWVGQYGWYKLYPVIKNKIGDTSVAPQPSSGLKYNENHKTANSLDVNNYDLSSVKIKKDGNLTIENGSYTISGKTYKTKMGKYTIGYNNKLNCRIEIVTENGSKYTGVYSGGYIYSTDEITDNIKSVKISQSYEGYKARLIIIGTGASQARMIAYAQKTTISKSDSTEDVPEQSVDVSLQKYITKVISADNTVTYENQTERKNKYADKDENFVTDTSSNVHQGVEISNKSGEKLDNDNVEYKSANPVKIEAGDTVEYTIKVYNNSDHAVRVTAKDVIDNRAEMLSDYKHDKDTTYFLCENEEFAANETKTFTVQLKYSEYTADKIMNKAWIANTNPSNKKEHRTVDADYIEMLKYSVALEKFVSAVNNETLGKYQEKYDIDNNGILDDKDVKIINDIATGVAGKVYEKGDINGDGKINTIDVGILNSYIKLTVDGREGYPTYEDTEEKNKEKAPVEVEIGDEVTYTIKLINTGEAVIKVTEITDVFNNEEIEYIDGTATGYGTPSVEKDGDGNLIIKISNPEPIEPEQSKYLTLNFKVKVSGDNLDEDQKFKNTATVTKITNKNNNVEEVPDSDGPDNNTDSDWIKPKLYAVSLEKFISAVNGKEPTGDDGDREGKAEYLTLKPDGTYVNETNKDPMGAPNTYKQDHIVTVSKGNTVTYTIKVTNDGDASVYVSEIEDIFPSGVKYNEGESTVKFTNNPSESGAIYIKELENLLEPGESALFTVEVEVIADNFSMEVYKNTAKITKIQEKTKTYDITDSTPNDNEDSDYIDLNPPQDDPNDDVASYSVEKIWSDKGNKAGKRPSSITVELHRVGEGKVEEVTLSASNGWKYKWENLKKYDESKNEYQYSVKEISNIDGYKTYYTTVGNKTIIENKYNDNTEQKIDITVKKHWKNDTVSTRPTSIKVQLYQDGNKYGSEVKLNESNSWSYTWEGLDKSHTYTPKEVDVPEDYTVEYNGYSIYNTYDPKVEKITHSVEKVWVDEDNKAGKRPSSITVELHRVGEGKVKEVTLNESNNWRYEWAGLDKYDKNKNEYQYFVKEISKISGYKTYYTSEKNKTIIENRYNDNTEQKIDITVNKEWKNDTVSTRPTSIKVQLYKDGNKYKSEVQLDESNKWSHTWEGLDKSHTYTVKEVDVPENYTVEYDGYTIYNIYNTDDIDEKTSYSVEKVWVDDNDKAGKRPASITVELHKVGEGKVGEATLSASDGWKHKWENLEKYDESKNEYQYFVKETSNIDGYKTYYTTEGNKTKIENRYNDNTEQKIDITVNKYWKNDTTATRPTSIKVQLYQDGNKYGAEVQLDGSNSWSHTWEDLDKSYTYTVKEVDVPENYTVEYDGYTIYNTYDSDDPDDPDDPDKYGTISGFVWNDIPLNKIQDNYNGLYDHGQENKIPGIKVYLYRTGVSLPVASEITDENGYYGFYDSDLTTDLPENQRYLKGPKDAANNRWTGEYYSYHIVFEYDGLTYTSTQYSTIDNLSSSERDSNAKEDLTDRTAFNDKFTTIKYDGAYDSSGNKTINMDYTTVNNSGYIPESKYVYNEETMIMKSSTELINMGEVSDYEEQLKYINLGIRGRDIFDLELTSDIQEVEVKINNQKAVYKNTNNINIRKSDFKVDSQYEDMANTESEKEKQLNNNEDYLQEYYQNVRDEDINYLKDVYITQKITIHNASRTTGIVNCVDTYFWADELEVVSIKDSDGNELERGSVQASNISGGNRDKISFYPRKELKANEKTEIFVKYKLKLAFSESPALYPIIIAEISEYKTVNDGTDDNEFTRGLIDKDSRPGSFDQEKVRLHEGEGSEIFDVNMINNNGFLNLKFEDDTYLNIVRFRKNVDEEFERTISGTVFEDNTKVEKTKRIKTGNGKLDENEVGIFGANVELIDSGNNVVATTSTDQNGRFSFSGFIPGEYTIRYRYGDTTNTVLLGQKEVEEGKYINRYSYNGADYQSTNNHTEVDGVDEDGVAIETNILNTTENFWYLYNELEGISTATDFADRRDQIIDKVAAYNKESEITRLNDIRQYIIDANKSEIIGKINDEGKKDSSAEDGRTVEDINQVIEDTNMFATTAKFLIKVEKPEIKEGAIVDSNTFGPYKIENMNFGLSKVPTTKLNLQKHISGFTIKDSIGSNTIAMAAMAMDENGNWVFDETKGNVLPATEGYSVQIEDEKLQGARLEITYQISKKTEVELDVDGSATSATTGLDIKGLVDLIDNNLSYNKDLGSNSLYWDVITVDALKGELATTMDQYPNEFFELPATATKEQKNDKINAIINEMKINNNTIVRLKDDSAFWKIGKGEATVPITLEKVLAPTSTLEELIDDVANINTYRNTLRITNSDYKSGIKNDKGLTVLPGIQGDTVEAEVLAIVQPFGDSSANIVYLLIAIVSLAILAAGVFGIKKFVIKK